MTHQRSQPIGRRGLLAAVGAAGLSAATASTAAAASSSALPLTAQTTEGLDGVPLAVRFTVLDTAGRPLRNLRVDLWHCDMQGRYSGFGEQGDDRALSFEAQTFLRGSQHTDRGGAVSFDTIYPGWYAGRTTHIHFKVINGTRAVLTSQFFLPDALSEFLYTQVPGYKRARLRDTLNSADGIALKAGDTVLGAVREEHRRYVAVLTLVVDPASHPLVDRPPRPGFADGPGGPDGPWGDRPSRLRLLDGTARIKALMPPRAEG
jgi:protocatechuate 3,4-dioxygenase beta subunit